MLGQLFKTLIDSTTKEAYALTKRVVGDAMDGTVNAMATFIGKDTDGNAAFAKFNSEGSLVVTGDAGAPTDGDPIVHLEGAQTKGQEDEAGTVALEQSKSYKVGCKDIQLISTRDMLWRAAWVSDNAGTPVETTIGYGFSGPGKPVSYISPSKSEFTTTGTGDQVLKLYATPLDNVSDSYANVKAIKLD